LATEGNVVFDEVFNLFDELGNVGSQVLTGEAFFQKLYDKSDELRSVNKVRTWHSPSSGP
jgi:hypothetical protein